MKQAKLTEVPAFISKMGEQSITVQTTDGEDVRVTFSLEDARQLVRLMQHHLLEMAARGKEPPEFPEFRVGNIQAGHGIAGSTALLVETGQTGNLSLVLTLETAKLMRSELDRLIEMLPNKAQTH